MTPRRNGGGPIPEPSGMDPDYLAFRGLLAQAERDPVIAEDLTRLMQAGAPLSDLLALRVPDRLPEGQTPIRCRKFGLK